MADEIIIIGFQDDAFTSPTCNRVRSLIIRWYAFACNFDIMQTQQTPLLFECKMAIWVSVKPKKCNNVFAVPEFKNNNIHTEILKPCESVCVSTLTWRKEKRLNLSTRNYSQ